MRWTPKDECEWHKWFAWHPVMIGNQSIWLETIQRKMRYIGWEMYTVEYKLD